MFKNTRLQMIVMLAVGGLLGYAAASETVMPRWGKVGKQKIVDEGPLPPYPFFAFRELEGALGEGKLCALFFDRRAPGVF